MTNREAHEEAAGMALDNSFFRFNGIDPDAECIESKKVERVIKLKKIKCADEKYCTTSRYYCNTCLRNKANIYSDKFSIKKEGYNSLEDWGKK